MRIQENFKGVAGLDPSKIDHGFKMAAEGFDQIFGEPPGPEGRGEVLSLENLPGDDPVGRRGRGRLDLEKSFLPFREARFLRGRPEEISPQKESDRG